MEKGYAFEVLTKINKDPIRVHTQKYNNNIHKGETSEKNAFNISASMEKIQLYILHC